MAAILNDGEARLTGDAALELHEHSGTPTPVEDYAKVYTKSDNKAYFQDGAGVEHEIGSSQELMGEGYFHANAVATVIETANTPIALYGATTDVMVGLTYDVGSAGAITTFADYSGTVAGAVLVSSAGHGLAMDDIITIRGTTNYNGAFLVTVVGVDSFYITDAWVADDGASNWEQPGTFLIPAGGAGIYRIAGFICTAPTAACELKFATWVNITKQNKSESCRDYAINDKDTVTSTCLLQLSAGDRIWVAVESDNTANITNVNGNFNMRRI